MRPNIRIIFSAFAIVAILAGVTFLTVYAFSDQDDMTQADYETAALEAAEVMTTWQPAEDFNRTAAEQRARYLMTDELAANIITPERPATGTEWNTAADSEATSQPSVEINNYTESQDCTVSVLATWEWVTTNGELIPNEDDERIYHLAFNDDGELVDYTYETVPQHQGAGQSVNSSRYQHRGPQ